MFASAFFVEIFQDFQVSLLDGANFQLRENLYLKVTLTENALEN
jgi:hypothetical protein